MRLLAIGDIHGCYTALKTLLAYVNIQPNDQIITLGDYVDRGPQTCEVLDYLIELYSSGQLLPLRGNHEIMMMEARYSDSNRNFWLRCGGLEALESYASATGALHLSNIPAAHWGFLELACRDWHENDRLLFAHASIDAQTPMDEQISDHLHWGSFEAAQPHFTGKVFICGHTEQRSGHPKDRGHAVCIDTWAYGHGWLTCLDASTGEYWQANNQGQTRQGWLEYSGWDPNERG